MPEGLTRSGAASARPSKDVQAVEIDGVDRRILTALHADARMPNSALAELVGIAPSTCHGRLRRLQELGVIRGFYTDIDPTAIGLTPQVMDVYFLAGADDFILHVAARDTDDLRAFVVENLNADADVAGTQTSLIFEHLRGASPL